MLTRLLILYSLLALVCVGCGGSEATSTSADELSQFIAENPESAVDYGDVDLEEGDTAQ